MARACVCVCVEGRREEEEEEYEDLGGAWTGPGRSERRGGGQFSLPLAVVLEGCATHLLRVTTLPANLLH